MEEERQDHERQQTCLMEDHRIYLSRAGIVKEDKDGRQKQEGGSGKKEGKQKKKDLFLCRLSSRVLLRPSLTVLFSFFHPSF